ncbi:polynucleotidyl transferase [Striga asiatica]|uniref:Polynucleotidyl transferase n=1 Tax=Striga asiatica TaxID=4170 RepID=A0A5A7R5L9_STRAF|nr:polynucleotidyl transferase [Striga asiatica]
MLWITIARRSEKPNEMTSTTDHQLSSEVFNVKFFNDVIQTTVTHDPAMASRWISGVTSLYGRYRMVGLDVEWRPNRPSRPDNPAATLQISAGRFCLIYQLIHSPYFPLHLAQFLSCYGHDFVGVGVKSDLEKLWRDHRMGYTAIPVDLRGLAADVYGSTNLKKAGLQELARTVLGTEMEKPKAVKMSAWDNRCLSPEQVRYASVDAFVSFQIGRVLYARAGF